MKLNKFDSPDKFRVETRLVCLQFDNSYDKQVSRNVRRLEQFKIILISEIKVCYKAESMLTAIHR